MATINKQGLAELAAKKNGEKESKLRELINDVTEIIIDEVAKGNTVDIYGFGKFEPKERAERQGRNPRTKEEITIPASTVPNFKPGKVFKDRVNK